MLDLHGYGAGLLWGMGMTVAASLCSVVVAVILGMAGALAKLSGVRPLVWIANAYTTVIRGIPDLVLLFIVFYMGQTLINNLGARFGVEEGSLDVNPFVAGITALGFIYGAYMAETFRGAILAVPRGQMEAANAFGMGRIKAFWRILLPQMARHALPGFGNNWLVLIKATALLSVINLEDMVRKAQLAAGTTHEPFNFYLAVGFLYLVLTTISVILLRLAEQRYNVGFVRT